MSDRVETRDVREAPRGLLGLMLTIWVIVNFTAINLYLKWTGG